MEIFNNSQLVVYQVKEEYQSQGENTITYLECTYALLFEFAHFNITQVFCAKNTHVDALTRLASTKDAQLLDVILIEYLKKPNVLSFSKVTTTKE